MRQTIVNRVLMIAASTLVLPFLAQTAHAGSITDFDCPNGASVCSGTLVQVGSVFSTTGIGGLVSNTIGAPDFLTGAFNLVFSTATDAITLTGNAAANNDKFIGMITGVNSATPGDLLLTVSWTTLPTDFATFLNATTGTGVGSIIVDGSNNAVSVDFAITATPEPASVIMLGTGLLGLCGLIRRKTFNVGGLNS